MTDQIHSQNASPTNTYAKRRGMAIRITFVTGILLFIASIPTLVTTSPELSLNYVGNIIALTMSLIAFVCAWIAYRHDAGRASLIFIGVLMLVSLGIPFYANGLGLQSGTIVGIIVVSVASTTLPGHLAARISTMAVIAESAIILADLYLPDFGIEELRSPFINPFLVVIILVFAYYVFRQYEFYPFRTKLIFSFVAVASLAVSLVAIGFNTIGRRELTEQAGRNVNDLAGTLASNIGNSLVTEIRLLQVLGAQFEESAGEISGAYPEESPEAITEGLIALDADWRSAGDNSPLIQNILSNEFSRELLEFKEFSPQHIEVLVTDKFGANIASTNRTSGYYQADEEWWQRAFNSGNGAVYIGQPGFDESSNKYTVSMAVPLYHEGRVVGILHSTLDVTYLTSLLGEARMIDVVGQAHLRYHGSQLLGSSDLSPEDLDNLDRLSGTHGEIEFGQRQRLVSEVAVSAPEEELATEAVANLEWSVIVHQDIEQALMPVQDQARTTIVISMGVLMAAALLGFLASQRLAAPLVNLTGITNRIAQGELNVRGDVQTQDEIGALSTSFNRMTDQLQETLKGLEQRIAERTADLEAARMESDERAQALQSINEISRIISSEQRLDILLPLITRLVSEKFDFYHCAIFLVDDNRIFANLQAANSEGGQRMLNRGHRLELGTGIVGTVAITGKPRIALDVGSDAVFFDNPDLPATRSEMALPLLARGETIGVLDVQSIRANEFTEQDVNILGILADHVAITIENVRLFARTQQALEEVQALYNQYLQKEWKRLQGKTRNIGYWQTLSGGKPLEAPVDSDDIRHALRTGQTLISKANGTTSDTAVVAPIKLRGQTIGVLNIRSASPDHEWSREELNLIQSVTDRLSLALENARLFEETTRRAERERLVSEITGKIRSVNDPQTIIQTALEELRNVLGASRVQVIPHTLSDSNKMVDS